MNKKRFKLLRNFEKKWVALNKSDSKVLASGITIEEVEKKIKKIKVRPTTIEYVIPFNSYFSPSCQ